MPGFFGTDGLGVSAKNLQGRVEGGSSAPFGLRGSQHPCVGRES